MDECVMETSSPTEASSDLNFNLDDEKVQSQEQRSSSAAVGGGGILAADSGGDNQNAAGVCYWYAHMQREVLFDICSTFKYLQSVHF